MILLRNDIAPDTATINKLAEYQFGVDGEANFDLKAAKAKQLFKSRNTKTNSTFQKIKLCLTAMCNSTRRCVYCEDSLGDEVEHIYPKDLYPEKCFIWDNYVYACGPCNGPKSNKFAVFTDADGSFVELAPATMPPAGGAAMINPRTEDPLKFAILDLAGSFKFYPLPSLNARDRKRMEYTFDDVLRLNDAEREPLRQARENAYHNYKARLFMYARKKSEGETQAILNNITDQLTKESHPTVWKEMQRYHIAGILAGVDAELDYLFIQAPEALAW